MRSNSAEPMAQPLTDTFDHKQTTVDRVSLGHQLGQVLEASQAADVGRLVDDGLDPQRPPFLQVLLDPAVLVAELQAHLGAGAEDPRAEDAGSGASHLPGEHGRHLVGPTDADVVGHQRLEESAGPAGVVEDQRAR